MPGNNQLATIVEKSGLEAAKAQVMLEQFQDYFAIAAEWETKAKAIIVTDESQKAEMQMARAGRIFLKEKRVAIEKTRKELKEQALREGKAIDGIANVLKALIVPIEEHLDKQEHFIEIRAKKIEDKRKAEEAQKAEAERIAREKAEAEEREHMRLENEKLKADADAQKQKIEAAERKRLKAEEDKRIAEARARVKQREAEKKQQEAHAEIERLKAEASKLSDELITCPKCGHTFELKGGETI